MAPVVGSVSLVGRSRALGCGRTHWTEFCKGQIPGTMEEGRGGGKGE